MPGFVGGVALVELDAVGLADVDVFGRVVGAVFELDVDIHSAVVHAVVEVDRLGPADVDPARVPQPVTIVVNIDGLDADDGGGRLVDDHHVPVEVVGKCNGTREGL